MKRSVFAAALALTLALPAAAMAYTSPTWNLNGPYTIDFTCTANCSGVYAHSMTITATSDTTGAVSGSGVGTAPNITWTVTGQVTGWDVHFDILYTDYLAGYTVSLDGTINQNGGMSGTAIDTLSEVLPGLPNEEFTWQTTSGSVGLFSPRCDYGTYPDATMVWFGFAPATGGNVTTTPLYPSLDYFVEASGTYFAGGNGLFDIEADAEYSQDALQRAASESWTDSVHNYGVYGPTLLDLFIDGAAVDWGAYSTSHRYTLDVVPTGSPLDISANIYDLAGAYGNNTGGLCVAVFAEHFDFAGFFAPVDNLPTFNSVKAGQGIPVKFSLGGDQGLDIFAAGYPKSQVIACDSSDPVDPLEVTVTAGGSSLSYDPITDQYAYVWKTQKTWAGSCRQLVVQLADGTFHRANFQLK